MKTRKKVYFERSIPLMRFRHFDANVRSSKKAYKYTMLLRCLQYDFCLSIKEISLLKFNKFNKKNVCNNGLNSLEEISTVLRKHEAMKLMRVINFGLVLFIQASVTEIRMDKKLTLCVV